MKPIYLDYNATTPVDPRVVEAMLPYFTQKFGNAASRAHEFGWIASEAVECVREQIASGLGAESVEVLFTSGATESLNTAILGVARNYASKGKRIIVLKTEHRAVLDPLAHLAEQGFDIQYVDVDKQGLLQISQLEELLNAQTILVCIMLANNETGVIQPIQQVSELVRKKGSLLLCDATQAIGKIPVHVQDLNVDLMAFSAHKFYGPKGVGALYVRRKNPRVTLQPLLFGGGHERGLRSGTLNVPGIIGMGEAFQLAMREREQESIRLEVLRNHLEVELHRVFPVEINGGKAPRLGHVSNVSFIGVRAEDLIMKIRPVCVSLGSACSSANLEPSHVLRAMNLNPEHIKGSMRFSLGRFTTQDEINQALELLCNALGRS